MMGYSTDTWMEYRRAVAVAEPAIRNSPPDAVYEIRDSNGNLVAFKGESRLSDGRRELKLRLL